MSAVYADAIVTVALLWLGRVLGGARCARSTRQRPSRLHT
jgi:hypothetical protein